MEPERIAELRRQVDALSPQQLATLQAHIRAFTPERKARLDRIAAHLATRFGRDPRSLPHLGTAYPNAHTNEAGQHDGFDLQIVGMPEISGPVTFAEWVYLTRKAAVEAIEQARIHVDGEFDTTAQIRAARDASLQDVSGQAPAQQETLASGR